LTATHRIATHKFLIHMLSCPEVPSDFCHKGKLCISIMLVIMVLVHQLLPMCLKS
jgi:hypothetical protein